MTRPISDENRTNPLVWLIGLHGLALMNVFPLGPQEARLWQPGVGGVALMAGAFPAAALLSVLIARRLARLPTQPRTLCALGFLATLPTIFSYDFCSFLIARIIGGWIAGLSLVAIHRIHIPTSSRWANQLPPLIIGIGMPICTLAATLLDWRLTAAPIVVALLWLWPKAGRPGSFDNRDHTAPCNHHHPTAFYLASVAFSFVTASYLTILSGCLVFNTGHTELHIPVVLALVMAATFLTPSVVSALLHRYQPKPLFIAVTVASCVGMVMLLRLDGPLPAILTVPLIAGFLSLNQARQPLLQALAQPLLPHTADSDHQIRNDLARYLGCSLGAICAGIVITKTPTGLLTGLKILLACGVTASVVALVAGLRFVHASASPAHRAASAKSRWRVATSFARFVRTSMTRTPESID